MVVFDVSYLQTFLSTIKSAIGVSTNIGILIFGFLMSILLVIRIVKSFSNPR